MKVKSTKAVISAFAPATVANVAVGFDVLGFAFGAAGDTVQLESQRDRILSIEKIIGDGEIGNMDVAQIPQDPMKNTAGRVVHRMMIELKIPHGFRMTIQKGIPLSSGMGGSAASAVAAALAASRFSRKKLSSENLIDFALTGEEVASGSRHADNIAPSLVGGLVSVLSVDPVRFLQWKYPKDLFCVLVHPGTQLETSFARRILKADISLHSHVRQSARLVGFLKGCEEANWSLIRDCLMDEIIEPQRSHLIPGFSEAQAAARAAGALGFSISGAGPCLFALAKGKASAGRIELALLKIFSGMGLEGVRSWCAQISKKGAHILS